MTTRRETEFGGNDGRDRPGGETGRRPGLRVAVATVCAVAVSACNPGAGKTAYVGGNLWDGSGGPPIVGAVVVVDGDRIDRAGPAGEVGVPRGATEVRVDGKWIIPGLIDAHVHTERWMLTRFLAYGVTAVRDGGGRSDSIVALQNAVALGSIPGPRLFTAAAMIDGAPASWPTAATVARTGQQARRAVDQRALLDASHAKVHTKIDSALLAEALDEARELNLPVMAHLGKVHALAAARMGVVSVEHLSGVVEASAPDPRPFYRAHDNFFDGWNMAERGWAGLDSARLAQTAAALQRTGVAMVPTLVLHEGYSRLSDDGYLARLDYAGVPDTIRRGWYIPAFMRRAGVRPSDFAAFRQGRPMQNLFLRAFKRAGGLVAAGTDTPNPVVPPGAGLHNELALLVQAGFTPQEALLAATRDAARLLSADSIGVIQEGALADFVVLSASPLDDIGNARRIEMVVSRGLARSASQLRALWQ